jgi:mannan endo-1,4-beta-mannosidase
LYGSYGLFAKLRNKPPSSFFIDPVLIADFKDLISFILNRVNTVTGIQYKNDPTLMSMQLGNELGSWTNVVPPTAWAIEIASYIKSIAPNILVMDATIGGTSRVQAEKLASPHIDIFTNHYYWGTASPEGDLARVSSYGKAFIVGEYGLVNVAWYNTFMSNCISLKTVSGCLIWSLRFHSYQGGFYQHPDGNYWAYHVPGFPQAFGFGSEEATLIPLIRSYAFQIQGLSSNVKHPVPRTPVAAAGTVTPTTLRWGGSAWAKGYNIERQDQGTNIWTRIASSVPDNVIGPATIYSDTSAQSGKSYNYRIQAVGVDGDLSGWLVIGLLRA